MCWKLLIFIFPLFFLGKSQVSNSDISNYFYSKSNPVLGNTVNISNPFDLDKVGFSKDLDTVFIIHGYMERPVSTDSSASLKKVILSKHDANVIVVDYSKFSTDFYPEAVQQIENVGKVLARMIKNMIKNSGLSLNKTKIVGVSLGAHVAGVTGNVLDGEVDQIVGVDPALPLFTLENTSNRLTKSSAKFVHVIHTNGGLFGFYEPLGDADYYVNGGRRQPMCGQNPLPMCSHILSVAYYSESLEGGNFKAVKCDSYANFKKGKCTDGERSWMGGYNVDKNAHGKYFLDTKITPPYAKG